MATISVSLPSDGDTIDAADYNTPITTIVNEFNGEIDNANIATDAAIAGSKLADSSVTGAKLGTPVAFLARRGSSQSISASTLTKVQFNTELFDDGDNYDNSTNYRFTAPNDGRYQINWTVAFTLSGRSFTSLYINGTETYRGTDASNSLGSTGSIVLNLSAGDYLEVYGWNDTSSNSFAGGTGKSSYFSGHLVGRI